MFRLLFIFLSSFFNNLFSYNMFNIKDEYVMTMKEKEKEEQIVLKEKDGLKLIYNKNVYILMSDKVNIILNTSIEEVLDYYTEDNNIYVIVKEKTYKIIKYDQKGKIGDTKNINEYLNISKPIINMFYDDFVYTGTCNDNTIFIGNNEKVKLFKGSKSQKVESFVKKDDNYYLYIEKELVSENVFGNGSNKILVHLDESYDILKQINLNDDNYEYLLCENNYIYLKSNKYIRLYKKDLTYCNKLELCDKSLVFTGKNGLLVEFSQKRIYLFDSITLKKLKEIEASFTSDLTKVQKVNNAFYIDNYYIDFINLTNIIINENCLPDFEYLDVNSFFGMCKYNNTTYDTAFDRGVYGTYNGTIEYITPLGIYFQVDYIYKIPLRCNVIEGGVYRNGYHILHNAKAKLDGEYIYNNDVVNEVGYHTLILEGNKEKTRISFYVSDKQISFENKLITKGNTFLINDNPYIELKFINYENYEIKRINIINRDIKNYTFENGVLKIYFEKSKYCENYYVFLKSIDFLIYDNIYTLNLGEVFYINIINDIKEKISNYVNNETLEIKYKLSLLKAEMLLVRVIENNVEKDSYFSLSTQDIKIDGINEENCQVKIFLVCDVGDSYYYEEELTELNSNNNKVCELVINRYEDDLREFTLKFDDKNAKNIKINNKIIFEGNKTNYESIIIHTIICLISSFLIGKLLYIIKKKKRKTI